MSNDNVIAKEARALLTAVKYTGLKNLGELPGASADAGMGYEARVPEAFVARLESALGGDGSSAGRRCHCSAWFARGAGCVPAMERMMRFALGCVRAAHSTQFRGNQ